MALGGKKKKKVIVLSLAFEGASPFWQHFGF